ncbi:MAG: type II secretion system minor pseudopilin GspJ [Nevskiaceae bacterium]|jgi:general secretion pathway protein J|nr:type II secretion system minor pseudopilin GspJ [Nevskiaceae bacterium]
MKPSRGFTLIEVIVAMLITAIIFALGYGALNQALGNRETIDANAARLQQLQSTMRYLVQDFSQAAPRPARDPLGEDYLPAMRGETSQVVFTRGGWMNPAGVQRSTLQRVRYVLEDGKLYREQWPVLDATLDPLPTRRVLLEQVRAFTLRYMNDGRNWQTDWPPQLQGGQRTERELRWRPIAVEVTITTEDFGTVVRLIEVPG